MLGVHPDTVRNWFDSGHLKGYVTPSKRRKVSLKAVEALIGEVSK